MTVITITSTPRQLAVFYADCMECNNRKIRADGGSMCLVKHIDCSVRKGQRPCSHFASIKPVKESKKFKILLTACATQFVTASDMQSAAKMADWCEADMEDWEVSEVEEV